MGLVSPSQSNAGDQITAASINNPINQLAAALNGNLDANNILDGAVTTTKIADGAVTTKKLANFNELIGNFVYSGGAVAISSGLTGTLSNVVYYINGVRYTANGIANKTYTASQDTYVDIDTTGTVTYNAVANGAAAPSLAANNIRLAKVVTNGSAITSIVQSGVDSNLKPIDPLSPLNILSNIFGQQVQSYTNTGSGGGTFNYINLGGIKLLWGTFGPYGTAGSLATSTLGINFPTGFFSVGPYIVATTGPNGQQYIVWNSPTATSATITTQNAQAGAIANQYTTIICIGT